MTAMRREIGLFGGISVLAGIMIGSGIFYIGGIVLARCEMSLGLSLLVWLVGGLITLMSGVCYAELGAMMPKAGGSYVYLREAYGERTAFVSGFSNFILSSSASIAALAVAFAGALATVLPLGPVALLGLQPRPVRSLPRPNNTQNYLQQYISVGKFFGKAQFCVLFCREAPSCPERPSSSSRPMTPLVPPRPAHLVAPAVLPLSAHVTHQPGSSLTCSSAFSLTTAASCTSLS